MYLKAIRSACLTLLVVCLLGLHGQARLAHAQTITLTNFAGDPERNGRQLVCAVQKLLGLTITIAPADCPPDPGALQLVRRVQLPPGEYRLAVRRDDASSSGLPPIIFDTSLSSFELVGTTAIPISVINGFDADVGQCNGDQTPAGFAGGRAVITRSAGAQTFGFLYAENSNAPQASIVLRNIEMQGGNRIIAGNGGAVRIGERPQRRTPDLTIERCIFSANTAAVAGGAVSIEGSSTFGTQITVSETAFLGNRAVVGGAISTTRTSARISGCVFRCNQVAVGSKGGEPRGGAMAWDSGGIQGLLYVIEDAEVANARRTVFRRNSALAGLGGAMYITGATGRADLMPALRLTEGRGAGADLSLLHDAALVAVMGVHADFLDNQATLGTTGGAGGAVHMLSSALSFLFCDFQRNTAARSGGGVFNADGQDSGQGVTSFYRCVFDSNVTNVPSDQTSFELGLGGGGLFNRNSSPLVFESCFRSNSSTVSGGGMANTSESNPVIDDCAFTNNTAAIGAGVSAANNTRLVMFNTQVTNNIASNLGSGVFVRSALATILHTTIAGNGQVGSAAAAGAGLYTDINVGTSMVNFLNSITWGNSGPGIVDAGTMPTTARFSDVQVGAAVIGGCSALVWPGPGGNNINCDPRLTALASNDVHLLNPSPCIDTASKALELSTIVSLPTLPGGYTLDSILGDYDDCDELCTQARCRTLRPTQCESDMGADEARSIFEIDVPPTRAVCIGGMQTIQSTIDKVLPAGGQCPNDTPPNCGEPAVGALPPLRYQWWKRPMVGNPVKVETLPGFGTRITIEDSGRRLKFTNTLLVDKGTYFLSVFRCDPNTPPQYCVTDEQCTRSDDVMLWVINPPTTSTPPVNKAVCVGGMQMWEIAPPVIDPNEINACGTVNVEWFRRSGATRTRILRCNEVGADQNRCVRADGLKLTINGALLADEGDYEVCLVCSNLAADPMKCGAACYPFNLNVIIPPTLQDPPDRRVCEGGNQKFTINPPVSSDPKCQTVLVEWFRVVGGVRQTTPIPLCNSATPAPRVCVTPDRLMLQINNATEIKDEGDYEVCARCVSDLLTAPGKCGENCQRFRLDVVPLPSIPQPADVKVCDGGTQSITIPTPTNPDPTGCGTPRIQWFKTGNATPIPTCVSAGNPRVCVSTNGLTLTITGAVPGDDGEYSVCLDCPSFDLLDEAKCPPRCYFFRVEVIQRPTIPPPPDVTICLGANTTITIPVPTVLEPALCGSVDIRWYRVSGMTQTEIGTVGPRVFVNLPERRSITINDAVLADSGVYRVCLSCTKPALGAGAKCSPRCYDFNVTVIPRPSTTPPENKRVCVGGTQSWTIPAPTVPTGCGNVSIRWTKVGDVNPVPLCSSSTPAPRVCVSPDFRTLTVTNATLPDEGNYRVCLRCDAFPPSNPAAFACAEQCYDFALDVVPDPTFNPPPDRTICVGGTQTFTITAPVNLDPTGCGTPVITWFAPGSNTPITTTGRVTVSPDGLTLTITNAMAADNGLWRVCVTCSNFATSPLKCPSDCRSFNVQVFDPPMVMNPGNKTVCLGNSQTFTIPQPTNPSTLKCGNLIIEWYKVDPINPGPGDRLIRPCATPAPNPPGPNDVLAETCVSADGLTLTVGNVKSDDLGTYRVCVRCASLTELKCQRDCEKFTLTLEGPPTAKCPSDQTICEGTESNIVFPVQNLPANPTACGTPVYTLRRPSQTPFPLCSADAAAPICVIQNAGTLTLRFRNPKFGNYADGGAMPGDSGIYQLCVRCQNQPDACADCCTFNVTVFRACYADVPDLKLCVNGAQTYTINPVTPPTCTNCVATWTKISGPNTGAVPACTPQSAGPCISNNGRTFEIRVGNVNQSGRYRLTLVCEGAPVNLPCREFIDEFNVDVINLAIVPIPDQFVCRNGGMQTVTAEATASLPAGCTLACSFFRVVPGTPNPTEAAIPAGVSQLNGCTYDVSNCTLKITAGPAANCAGTYRACIEVSGLNSTKCTRKCDDFVLTIYDGPTITSPPQTKFVCAPFDHPTDNTRDKPGGQQSFTATATFPMLPGTLRCTPKIEWVRNGVVIVPDINKYDIVETGNDIQRTSTLTIKNIVGNPCPITGNQTGDAGQYLARARCTDIPALKCASFEQCNNLILVDTPFIPDSKILACPEDRFELCIDLPDPCERGLNLCPNTTAPTFPGYVFRWVGPEGEISPSSLDPTPSVDASGNPCLIFPRIRAGNPGDGITPPETRQFGNYKLFIARNLLSGKCFESEVRITINEKPPEMCPCYCIDCCWDNGDAPQPPSTVEREGVSSKLPLRTPAEFQETLAADDFYLHEGQVHRVDRFLATFYTNHSRDFSNFVTPPRGRLKLFKDCNGLPGELIATYFSVKACGLPPLPDGTKQIQFDFRPANLWLRGGTYWIAVQAIGDGVTGSGPPSQGNQFEASWAVSEDLDILGKNPVFLDLQDSDGDMITNEWIEAKFCSINAPCCRNLAFCVECDPCKILVDQGPPALGLTTGAGARSEKHPGNGRDSRAADQVAVPPCTDQKVCYIDTTVYTNCSEFNVVLEVYNEVCAQVGIRRYGLPDFTLTSMPYYLLSASRKTQVFKPDGTPEVVRIDGVDMFVFRVEFFPPNLHLLKGRNYWFSVSIQTGSGFALWQRAYWAFNRGDCPTCNVLIKPGFELAPGRSPPIPIWTQVPSKRDFSFLVAVEDPDKFRPTRQPSPTPPPGAGSGTLNCPTDINLDGTVDADDIFTFLNLWFAGCP